MLKGQVSIEFYMILPFAIDAILQLKKTKQLSFVINDKPIVQGFPFEKLQM